MINTDKNSAYSFDAAHSKRVSYVLATKNRAGFLESALERAKELIGPDDELLLIDGGSNDNTLEIVKSFGNLVNVFVSEPDGNAYEASNKGIMLARGRYIYLMSDDDIVYREGIEKAIEVLNRYSEIDLLVCGGMRKYGTKKLPYWLPPGTNYGSSPEDVFRYNACGMGFVYRQKTFAKFGLCNSVAADGDFVARVIYQGGRVRFCRIYLFEHAIYPHSIINTRRRQHQLARLRIAREYCSRIFYLRYRLRVFLREGSFRRVYKRIHKFLKIRIFASSARKRKKIEYIWDGGFS